MDEHGRVQGQPRNDALTPESTVDEVLDALDRVGRDLRTLHTAVVLTEIDLITGKPVKRAGNVYLQRGDEGVTFRAAFDRVVVEDASGKEVMRPEKVEYVLRGDELIDRDYAKRTQVTRKLPPEQKGRDLLKLGEGPFPLPIGQSKEEVRKQFEVTEVNPADPNQNELEVTAEPGTRRLRLTPRENSPLAKDFAYVEIDVSLAEGKPVQVITLDTRGETARVTRLRSFVVNEALPADAFALEPIDARQWNVSVEEMR